jgi:hypothetical protein
MGDIVESILLEAECRRLGFQITKSHFNLSAWLVAPANLALLNMIKTGCAQSRDRF